MKEAVVMAEGLSTSGECVAAAAVALLPPPMSKDGVDAILGLGVMEAVLQALALALTQALAVALPAP